MTPASEDSRNLEGSSQLAHLRRAQIAAWVRQKGSARVQDLARRFEVSAVTVRSDLDALEAGGILIRDHGGAIAAEGVPTRSVTTLLGFDQRQALHSEPKRRIGQAAAALVQPGDTIVMDAGTTVVAMVPHLAGIASLTVVTNALNVALEVGAATDARVLLLGGTLSREAGCVLGPQTEQALAELVVSRCFLGTQAFDLENGLTDTTPEIAQAKRAMIRAARQVILLCDSSKWDQSGFIKVAPLTAAQILISDDALPAEARASIGRLGIEVRCV